MEKNIVVVYRYEVAGHVSEQDFLQQHEQAMGFLKSQPGHIYTSLSRDEKGVWLDINYWSDADKLESANSAFEADESCRQFMAQLNPQSISMEQGELLANSQIQ